jgi:putative transposase
LSLTTDPVPSSISSKEEGEPNHRPSYPQARAADDSSASFPQPTAGGAAKTAPGEIIPAEMLDQIMSTVRTDGLALIGEGGVLSQLTKAIIERALEEERSEHLGYEVGDPAGRGSGNSRNGTFPKRVLTDAGPIDLDIPRDRAGTFEPKLVPNG